MNNQFSDEETLALKDLNFYFYLSICSFNLSIMFSKLSFTTLNSNLSF